jgi:hypothetical protein
MESIDAPRGKGRLEGLHASPAWKSIRLRLVAKAYEINRNSLRGVDDFVQDASLDFVERYGHDVEALGGVDAVVKLTVPFIKNARDRKRQSLAERKGQYQLTERVREKCGGASPDPEALLIAAQTGALWERYMDRIAELAGSDPCLGVLLRALDDGEDPGDAALAATFSHADLHNARRRLGRLAERAARELGIAPSQAGATAPGKHTQGEEP